MKEFIVKYGDEQSSTIKGKTKSVHVFIDGHKMTKRATLPHHTQRTISGVYTTGSARRPFVFTEIRTTGWITFPLPTTLSDLLSIRVLSR